MPKVRGMFDGTRMDDMRLLLPLAVILYYAREATWDRITKVRLYEFSNTITLDDGVIHKWKQEDVSGGSLRSRWALTVTDQRGNLRMSKHYPTPEVPRELYARFARPNAEELYRLVDQYQPKERRAGR